MNMHMTATSFKGRTMALACLTLVGAVAPCAGAEWRLDFTGARPQMNWWSPAKQDNTCSLAYVTNAATGRQALEAHWDGKGTWMHVYQQPLATPLAPFERMLVRVRLSSDEALPDVRDCRVRIQDADMETFYISGPLRQQRVWRARGERELSFMLDETSLARAHVVRHGTNLNKRIDFPLKSFGLSFSFQEGAAPVRFRLSEITCTPLPKADASSLPEFTLAEPLYDADTVPMLVPRGGCTVARVPEPTTGRTAIGLSCARPRLDFGFDFCRYGSPMGALAPKLPVHEVGELVFDVSNGVPLDRLDLRVIDMASIVHNLRMETPELALPGRHTVVFKLPPTIVSNGRRNLGQSFGLFALGGISFHAPKAATGAVVRVTRVSMRYRARPADALALELDTGTLPRIVTPDAASRGVKVVVRNVTDRALAFDVALRLTDVRDDDAGWSLSERMAFGPGEAKTFTCPVPARYGTYYVNMTACPPGGGMLDESERQRAFAHFRPVGATPEVKDAPGFCFGSVCHLNPYFGNEAEIARMADAMALVGLKIVRTDFRTWSDFDYEWYDKVVDIFSARGINFDFILGAICHPDGTPDLEKSRTAYRTAFARYKGRVKFWEMFNEPDHDWGREHPLRAPGYAEVARQTAADLRELDPSAQFMSAGFCCFDHKIMGTFQRDAMAACWRVFDLHCFHGHGQYAHYRSVIDDKLLPMRKELGITIPWYANETALTMSNGTGEKTQAEALVKKLLFSWSRGAKGYTWYNMRGKGENPLEGEHGYGMLTMRLDPRAVYCAWNTLTDLCRDKEFEREVACGEGNRCYLLGGADGKVACLWREQPGGRRVVLRTSAARAEVSDIYGNRAPCAVTNGQLSLDISEEPVWLLLPPNADLINMPFPCVTSDTVELEDGVYRLDAPIILGPERSGMPEKPLVVRAKNRGKVVLSGMVAISDWQKTDLCGGNVWVGTIPGTGEIPGWSSAGCLHKIDLEKLETPISVFAKGERLTCARWPKAGTWAKIKEVLPSGGQPSGVLRVGADADVAAWAREKDLWAHGLWKYEWADAKCRVLDVDVMKRAIRVDDTMVKFGFLADRDFYVFNALSAIGGPGEWAVDRKSRKLYVWPKGDIHDVEVALLDHIVTAKGAANVRFEGIVFEGTRRETFRLEDVTNVVVDACCFRHTSKEAIRATGVRRLKVLGSDFYDLGEGGVWIEGGDIATLERGDNVVDNCHIGHFGKVVANYRPGVCMKGSGNAITHNLIHHTDHQAIMFNCTDLYIGWNVIHDTLQHNDDAGAIYCCGQGGRGWTDMRGTLIEHNFIHNSGRLPHSRNCQALYFDDSSSGIRVRYNLINRANIGVEGGGGNFHIVESNLLVSCGRPLEQGNRGIDTSFSNGSKQGKKGPLWVQLAKRYKNPAWAARFPEMKRILDLEDGGFAHWPLFNRFVGNVEVGCGEDAPGKDVEKRGNVWADNIKLKHETGCRDFLGRDWTLKPDSRAFAALGGDLGFAQAGLYDGERRFSPAVKFGEPVGVVQPPRPNYNALVVGSVAVQFRPRGWAGTSKDKRTCFAEQLVNCEPIRGFENILRLRLSTAKGEWTEYSFSFVPKSDLTADIHLLNTKNAFLTAYDDFRVLGAMVEDDIETGRGWRSVYEKQGDFVQQPPRASGLIEDSAWSFKAAKGRRFALVDAERHYVHRVELKKGVRVTVTFKARCAER